MVAIRSGIYRTTAASFDALFVPQSPTKAARVMQIACFAQYRETGFIRSENTSRLH
jgi:hypothetical protein